MPPQGDLHIAAHAQHTFLAVVALTGALFAAGCGGGDSESWTVQIGTPEADGSFGVDAFGNGDLALTMSTEGDMAGPNAGGRDIVVMRLDESGSEVWAHQFGGEANDSPLGISVGPDDGVYVGGFTEGDLAEPNAGSADVWLARFDPDGNEAWVRQFGGDGWDRGFDVAATDDGTFISGYSASTLDDSDPQPDGFDAFVASFDSDGNQRWIRHVGSDATDWGQGAVAVPDGGVTITGYTEGDLAAANAGLRDIFVARLDSAGDTVWVRQFGSDQLDWTQGVGLGAEGGVLVAGSTEGDFAVPNAGGRDALVMGLDADGNEVFRTQLGGPDLDSAYEVRLVDDGIVATGGFTGPVEGAGDGGGERDGVLIRLDEDGVVRQIDRLASAEVDDATGLTILPSGAVAFSGYTFGDLGADNAGENDVFVGMMP